MTERDPDEHDYEPADGEQEGAGADGGDGGDGDGGEASGAAGDGGDGADGGGLAHAVAELQQTVAGIVSGKGDQAASSSTSSTSSGPDIEAQVRAALSKVGKEGETETRLRKVEKAVERPPVSQGRWSRFFWGKVDA